MTQQWEPGTYYGPGSVVVYQGARYKIIQPHTSESGWEPPATPALWGREPDGAGYQDQPPPAQSQGQVGGGGYNPSYVQPGPQQPQQPQGNYPPEKQWDQHQEQKVDIPHEERKKSWQDLSPERKKQLELGGGLVAGLAAIGAGYYAYHEHQKGDEEKKANVWALQNWLQEANARTLDFRQRGPRGPATWVLTEGVNIPPNAIPGGEQNGQTLFICRGFQEGGLQIGKVSANPEQGAVIGYAHKEIRLPKYEILVGEQRALRWVDFRGRLHPEQLNARPVEGGREANGTPLFIAKAHYHNAVVPGKASEKLKGAFIPFANSEVTVEEYRVLCYA
ncbi:carbohydrate-binding module family 12 protein [Sparassis latifolia]|uniref:Chitin-binding type-3 domain-containing protein n=1 Tax=Sparassis crispa TaxID=139825 RepID=A0A401GMP7_9APHY|nr:hypothetical protein SCP_0500670 [Sparassis crispa]GBE83024.1 hypothetical protein SCP_0500670 [Sparassis crispa]